MVCLNIRIPERRFVFPVIVIYKDLSLTQSLRKTERNYFTTLFILSYVPDYMIAHSELVILSVPSLCLPLPSSLFFLLADPLEPFNPDSLVPLPESELLVFLVPSESFEEIRGSLKPRDDDTEGDGATAREGRITLEFRALRMSWVVFRMISSTDMLSAPNSADFLASSN